MVTIVGTGASCQQKCMLKILAPADSTARVGVALHEGQSGDKVYEQGGKTVKVG